LELFDTFRQEDGSISIITSWDYKIRFKGEQENIWNKNIDLLKEKNYSLQAIVSLTSFLIKDFDPKDIIDKFINKGFSFLNFERITPTGRASIDAFIKPKNSEIDLWLLEAYKYYIAVRDKIKIPILDMLEKATITKEKIGCRARNCQQTVITINPDGSVAGCPNCADKTYSDIYGNYNKEKHDNLIKMEQLRNRECYICEYFKYCNGDCHQLVWDKSGCPGLKRVMDYMLKWNTVKKRWQEHNDHVIY
jgi:radical SAM protein with 4Fe4S-binding SPASM domain